MYLSESCIFGFLWLSCTVNCKDTVYSNIEDSLNTSIPNPVGNNKYGLTIDVRVGTEEEGGDKVTANKGTTQGWPR